MVRVVTLYLSCNFNMTDESYNFPEQITSHGSYKRCIILLLEATTTVGDPSLGRLLA